MVRVVLTIYSDNLSVGMYIVHDASVDAYRSSNTTADTHCNYFVSVLCV